MNQSFHLLAQVATNIDPSEAGKGGGKIRRSIQCSIDEDSAAVVAQAV